MLIVTNLNVIQDGIADSYLKIGAVKGKLGIDYSVYM